MIVDTSVVAAILAREDDAEAFAVRIAATPDRRISVVSALEVTIFAVRRYGSDTEVVAWMRDVGLRLVPTDEGQYAVVREAFLRFGKGRHPAALNFGDCFSHALSKTAGLPLLYKGNDFGLTDVVSAMAPPAR